MVARHDDVGLVLWFTIIKMAFQLFQSQSRINTPNNHSGRKGLCSSRKYPYPPPPQRRALLLETPTPSEFPFHGVLVTPCYSLEFP